MNKLIFGVAAGQGLARGGANETMPPLSVEGFNGSLTWRDVACYFLFQQIVELITEVRAEDV